MQVRERREDLDDVRDRLVDGERVVLAVVGGHAILEDLLERPTADVLHDDVARAVEAREVVDLEDQRVLHLGEELALGDRGLERVLVAGVQQALEHDVPVGHVAVAGEVDPAEAAVRDAADDFVLAADEIARVQLRRERVRRPALRAEPFGRGRASPSRDRPTGAPHAEQNRFSSAPTGWPARSTAGRGSAPAGTLVMPAPRCCTRLLAVDQATRRPAQAGARRADRRARQLASRCS